MKDKYRTIDNKYFFNIIDLGIIEYKKAYNLQKSLVKIRQLGFIYDSLILVEHLPVFTIGCNGSIKNILVDNETLSKKGIELIETDRGGDITFHGPGQIVAYPIFDLTNRKRDIKLYLRMLEEVAIRFLKRYDIFGFRIPDATGVWLSESMKIASIGIGISKWVTYHGLSININTPLEYFDMIVPCGLQSCKMVSVSYLLGKTVCMKEAKERLLEDFNFIFNTNYEETISALDKKKSNTH